MWSNSFILETRKLESEKYEKNLESRITESEGLWKVIQVQRRELCWQNKVHGAKCIWTPQKSVPLPDLWPELCSVPYIPIKKTQRGAHLHASVSVVTYLGRATHGFENSSQERGMSQPAHDNRALRIPHPPVYKNLLPEPAEIHSSPGWGGSCYGGWIFRLGCAGAGQAKRLSSSISPCSSIEPQGVSKF
ncbi:uncharacterized protein LOC144288669 isoform X4 [Canis aureus]